MNRDAADCPFCEIGERGLPAHALHEDDLAYVLLDRDSRGFGHCMVVPLRHVRQLHELPTPEYERVFDLARRFAPRLTHATGKKAIGFVAFGSGLPHAHLHLVPHDYPSELLQAGGETLTDEQLAANAERLRGLLDAS